MTGRLAVALAVLAATSAPALAQERGADVAAASNLPCDDARDARIRAHLERERRAARRWNLAWGVGYGVVAAAQAGMAAAEWAPFTEVDTTFETSLWVGAGKATIGLVSRIILPLRAAQPGPVDPADPCGSLAAAERALAITAGNQRKSVLLNAGGGVLVNVAGGVYLGLATDDWTTAGVSAGMGIAVTIVNVLTHPRRSWRRGVPEDAGAPRVTWSPVFVPGARTLVGVAGAF